MYTIRLLTILSFLAIPALLVPITSAKAQTCPRSNPKTEIHQFSTKTKYYRGKSAWFLTTFATGHQPQNFAVLGLGGGPSWTSITAEFEGIPLKNYDAICLKVKKIDINFYIKPVVHVASEYKEGSCEFKEILTHEKKHIKVMRDWQKEFTSKLDLELKSIAKKIPAPAPVGAASIKAAQDAMMKTVHIKVDEFIMKEMYPVLSLRQKKVDSPLEYRLVASRCENW